MNNLRKTFYSRRSAGGGMCSAIRGCGRSASYVAAEDEILVISRSAQMRTCDTLLVTADFVCGTKSQITWERLTLDAKDQIL